MMVCSVHGRRWHAPTVGGAAPRCATCLHGTAAGAGSVAEMLDALAAEVTADREARDSGDDVPNWG